jgi:invasion protein IalB
MRMILIIPVCIMVMEYFYTAPSILAQEPAGNYTAKKISTHGDWTSYFSEENNSIVCFMSSVPVKAEGNYKRRGDIRSLVTHRPALKSRNVVSFVSGYPYKETEKVLVNISKDKFEFFTLGQRAWLAEEKDDDMFVDAMKKGSKMIVKGRSSRNTLTTDTYSLIGFTAAYKAISSKCEKFRSSGNIS